MPIHPCDHGRGYQYGPTGKCYTGPGAYQRALRQARAVHARKRATFGGRALTSVQSHVRDALYAIKAGRAQLAFDALYAAELALHCGGGGGPPAPADSRDLMAAWSAFRASLPPRDGFGAVEPALPTLFPAFRSQIESLLVNLAARTDPRGKPWRPRIFYAWRSPEEQKKIVERGDSDVLYSYHNVTDPNGDPQALAVDVIDRRYAWDLADKETAWTTAQRNRFWKALGEEAEALGLTWGGRWIKPYDPAHVQAYPQESGARLYLARGNWPPPSPEGGEVTVGGRCR